MQRLSISRAHAYVLVYSVTSRQSLEELGPIVRAMKEIKVRTLALIYCVLGKNYLLFLNRPLFFLSALPRGRIIPTFHRRNRTLLRSLARAKGDTTIFIANSVKQPSEQKVESRLERDEKANVRAGLPENQCRMLSPKTKYKLISRNTEMTFVQGDGMAEVPVMLVGNKKDEAQKREVSAETGQKLATNWGCGFIETSAKSNDNITE